MKCPKCGKTINKITARFHNCGGIKPRNSMMTISNTRNDEEDLFDVDCDYTDSGSEIDDDNDDDNDDE